MLKLVIVLWAMVVIAAVDPEGQSNSGAGNINRHTTGVVDCDIRETSAAQLSCYARLASSGVISDSVLMRKAKLISSKVIVDRKGWYFGFTDDGSLETGIYYDPVGKYWALNYQMFRWSMPHKRVTHMKTKGHLTFAYNWHDMDEPEPVKHWNEYTLLNGLPGANWVYADGGRVDGISNAQARYDCSKIHKYYDGTAKKLKHVTYFLDPKHFCREENHGFDIRVGKYVSGKTIIKRSGSVLGP